MTTNSSNSSKEKQSSDSDLADSLKTLATGFAPEEKLRIARMLLEEHPNHAVTIVAAVNDILPEIGERHKNSYLSSVFTSPLDKFWRSLVEI